MSGLELLRSLYPRVAKYDVAVLKALYENRGRQFLSVISQLPCHLNEQNIRLRYFRHDSSQLIAGKTAGTNFKYFLILGGAIRVNPRKEDELQWVLGEKRSLKTV